MQPYTPVTERRRLDWMDRCNWSFTIPILLLLALALANLVFSILSFVQLDEASKEDTPDVRASRLKLSNIFPAHVYTGNASTRDDPLYADDWESFYEWSEDRFSIKTLDIPYGSVWLAPGDACALLGVYRQFDHVKKKPFLKVSNLQTACNTHSAFANDYAPESHVLVPTSHDDYAVLMNKGHCVVKPQADKDYYSPITDEKLRPVCFIAALISAIVAGVTWATTTAAGATFVLTATASIVGIAVGTGELINMQVQDENGVTQTIVLSTACDAPARVLMRCLDEGGSDCFNEMDVVRRCHNENPL